MVSFYILSIRLHLKRKVLSDARVVSITKKEYRIALHFLQKSKKSLKSISDEWWNEICWSSQLFGIFTIK